MQLDTHKRLFVAVMVGSFLLAVIASVLSGRSVMAQGFAGLATLVLALHGLSSHPRARLAAYAISAGTSLAAIILMVATATG
ncbi:MAG TPA: hypothetical protein VGM81_05950 [Burkholderiaceae bacterium]|jgi:hypothetical protein